jgi:hypothetical protein
MSMLIRNTVILAKLETTYGTDASPTGASNALLVSDASFELSIDNVNRDLLRSSLGGSEQLAGTRYVKCEFTVELSGSGTAGTAPAWGPLLRGCGMAETVNAGSNVSYNPVSQGFESLTIYYYLDGAVHKALGCRGTCEISAELGGRPTLKFSFIGIYGGISASSNPAATLTAWKKPVAITDANAGDITIGATFTAATAAITGGTTYPSKGINITLGQKVEFVPLLGSESVEITGRETTGKLALDVTPAQAATMYADVLANATVSLALEIGTAAGSKVLLWAPTVQRINPKWEEYNGLALLGMDLRLVPNTGNDELVIAAK